MGVATDTRQLFEVLQSTETGLDSFKVTLAVGVSDKLNADELSTILSQLLSSNTGGFIVRLALIAP
jgi:hypothetical protein